MEPVTPSIYQMVQYKTLLLGSQRIGACFSMDLDNVLTQLILRRERLDRLDGIEHPEESIFVVVLSWDGTPVGIHPINMLGFKEVDIQNDDPDLSNQSRYAALPLSVFEGSETKYNVNMNWEYQFARYEAKICAAVQSAAQGACMGLHYMGNGRFRRRKRVTMDVFMYLK